MPTADFTDYLGFDVERLLERLARVAFQIADVQAEIARARSDELGAKSAGWSASVETTVTARGKAASYAAVPATQTVLELEAMRDGLREERDFLRLLVDVRVRTRELV